MKTLHRARLQIAHARRCAAGSRPTFWAIATAKCSRIRVRSSPRKSPSSRRLEQILQPTCIRTSTATSHHVVRINYYPPRGDAKEGWDNIDIFGWLGYPMQIKINFLCRDSILAAPLVLDLVLFMDLAQRAGMRGVQEWLSFYFKAPDDRPEPLSGTRYLYSVDEIEEHPALDARGRSHYASRIGILRLRAEVSTRKTRAQVNEARAAGRGRSSL